MGRLGDSFHRVSGDYDRGRPRYPVAAVAAMLDGLPEPADAVDVGAGTGQLTVALAAAGARVTAVEPGADTRQLLERRAAGVAQVVDARAEHLPLADASADLVVCADSFHWLDPDAAAAEFRRVLRDAGRLCVCGLVPAWTPAQSGAWAKETGAIVGPLWERSRHPLRSTGFTVPSVPSGSGFTEVRSLDVPFEFETDREGLLSLFGSWSAVAALAEAERADVRAQLAEVLDAHGVGAVELCYVARLRLYGCSGG
jgi:SAM-dependent methyltransferase